MVTSRESLKDRVKEWQHSSSRAKRWCYPVARAGWRAWLTLFDPDLRSQLVTSLRYGESYFQRSTFTTSNRYPDLFDECAKRLVSLTEPRILCFGCATGQEVFSLGERLPNAAIVGVDINARCIRQCEKQRVSGRHRFCHRASSEFERLESFDAIFCLAVFQRTENRDESGRSVSFGISFAQFEQELHMLDSKLKRGGLLFIDHSDFDFTETDLAGGYQALSFEPNRVRYRRPLFARDNRKVSDEQNLVRGFLKRS